MGWNYLSSSQIHASDISPYLYADCHCDFLTMKNMRPQDWVWEALITFTPRLFHSLLCKGTVSGLCKNLEILICHMSPQCLVTEATPTLIQTNQSQKSDTSQLGTISMGQCKKDVTPLLTHWSYAFLALTPWYVLYPTGSPTASRPGLCSSLFHARLNQLNKQHQPGNLGQSCYV